MGRFSKKSSLKLLKFSFDYLNSLFSTYADKEKLEDVMDWILEFEIKYLTVYALSTENLYNRSEEELEEMEKDLVHHLGIEFMDSHVKTYKKWAGIFGHEELDHDDEEKIQTGMITEFPEWTSPFWNMAR